MDDLRDAQQRAAVGPGGKRIAKSFVRPVKRADAALSVIAKRGLVADAAAGAEDQSAGSNRPPISRKPAPERSGVTSGRPSRFDSHCMRCASWPASTATG